MTRKRSVQHSIVPSRATLAYFTLDASGWVDRGYLLVGLVLDRCVSKLNPLITVRLAIHLFCTVV